jgi:hypothetical protein
MAARKSRAMLYPGVAPPPTPSASSSPTPSASHSERRARLAGDSRLMTPRLPSSTKGQSGANDSNAGSAASSSSTPSASCRRASS